MMTSFKSTILSRSSIPRESRSTYYRFTARMKASISTSSCVGLVLVAHSARAFIQAPTRYASSPSEHHARAACTSTSQRPRIWVSALFATEESTAASPGAVDGAVADGEGSAGAGGTVASDGVEAVVSNAGAGGETSTVVEQEEEQLTYEQITRKAKLEEIERLRSKEKFITQKTGDYECTQCSFVYRPFDEGQGALSGTQFEDLPSTWRCPVCKAPKDTFFAQTKTIAGFEENQQYGLGANSMTSGQKNLLIFGSLATFFVLFLAGYLLE